MARFDFLEVLCTLRDTGMVPVFYHRDAAVACQVLKACYEGGVRAFEFTDRGDFACEVFASLVKYAGKECPEMALGVGSVTDAPTAASYLNCGADFVVGPCFVEEVARLCNRRVVPYVPGCRTVAEIVAAQEAGCNLVKLFPAGCAGGPSFVKSVRGPLPRVQIMATGAVEPTEESLRAWFEAGVACVGMGSRLFPAPRLEAGDWMWIAGKCRFVLGVIRSCRRK